MYVGLHVRHPLFRSYFNKALIFSAAFRKIFKYQISIKSVHLEPSCSMGTDGRTDGQTDMTKLAVAFRNLSNAPKKKKTVNTAVVCFKILFHGMPYTTLDIQYFHILHPRL